MADANVTCDWRIFADFATPLILHAQYLYAGSDLSIELAATTHALDSTTIKLCLSPCLWADFYTIKSAIKVHTLLDLQVSIPTWVGVTFVTTTGVTTLNQLNPEPRSIFVIDRGYLTPHRLHSRQMKDDYFINRARRNLCFWRLYTQSIDHNDDLLCDQIIVLIHSYDSCPEKLRRICITVDGKTDAPNIMPCKRMITGRKYREKGTGIQYMCGH